MTDLPATFTAKTRRTNCTVWIGATNNKGYGLISINGKVQLAHRVAYEAEYGDIPEGMVIDHLCRVRNCVNAMHLEAVTNGENGRRGRAARTLREGDTCINGHLIPDGGLYRKPDGKTTECRACRGTGHQSGTRRTTIQRRADRVSADLAAADRVEDGAA